MGRPGLLNSVLGGDNTIVATVFLKGVFDMFFPDAAPRARSPEATVLSPKASSAPGPLNSVLGGPHTRLCLMSPTPIVRNYYL